MGSNHRTNSESWDVTEPATPPAYLLGKIVARISTEKEIAAAKRKAAYFSLALTGSVAVFSAALFSLWGSLIESEIIKLFSVFVSDPGASFANWQDSALFLLESLPVAHLAIFLVALLAVLHSLKYLAKYTSNAFSLSRSVKTIN